MLTTGSDGRRGACRIVATSLGLVAILAAGLAPSVLGRSNGWTLTRNPSGVQQGQPTTIAFNARNDSAGGGGGEIGCAEIVIPSVFSVGSVTVTAEAPGSSWTATKGPGPSGTTLVRVRALNDGSVLEGTPLQEAVGFSIGVTGSPAGTTTWTADVFNKTDCSDDMQLTKTFSVTISASGLATPVPTATPAPTPTPTPAPTPTPTPVPTATPKSTAPPTPTPTPPLGVTPPPTTAPTPTPTPTPTLAPGATPFPGQTATPMPAGSAGSSPDPSTSPGPSPSPGSAGSPSPAPTASATVTFGPSPSPGVGGSGGSGGDGDPPPGAAFTISVSGSDGSGTDSSLFGDTFSQFTALFGRAFDWAIPGLLLSVPGMLLVLAIAAQAAGALAWLPLVRRRIGGFGLRDAPRAQRP